MASSPVPVLRVAGSHRDVGWQIGRACADVLRAAADLEAAATPPPGRTVRDQLEIAAACREVTRRELPWLVEEIDGAAEAAGVDALALFAASAEELWVEAPSQPSEPARVADGAPRGTAGRCSDLVAVPPATAGDRVLVAHNNDLAPETEETLVAIEWAVPGEPVSFTIGIGPWISVGWNDAGLSVTGNELSPNDDRVGVPRLLLVREQLRQRTLEDAVAAALHPARASSYNTVFAHRDGGVANVEGSATDAEVTGPDASGTLAHTNHYVCDRMLPYEGDPAYARHSAVRYRRATDLLAEASRAGGGITTDRLLDMLADHEHAPDSICRHPEAGGRTKTVFWCVADVTAGRVVFGRGNPCRPVRQSHEFASA